MILGDLGQGLGRKVALALLLISSSAVGHLQHPPPYVTRYEPTAHNYSRSTTNGNLLHVSHSLPGRSSISITRGSSRLGSQSQISASRLITPSAPSSNHGFNGASSHRAHHGVSHQKVVQDNGGSHDGGISPLKNVVPLVTSNDLNP